MCELLSKRSGLIAIAGTGNMEELAAKEASVSKAAEAIHYSVTRQESRSAHWQRRWWG
ncbi:hypothetical protein [Mucilaginibacter aquariorum]|uniref:Uncharacterized protein n=1 Tax=Mucilaginibacter aquariorum TaxID=2967225 RepID=A0ABT1T3S7_9SPHI|nr:hypothetical protein [Mucilaginibacter aquariorum]MCQ6959260.1 hypothetical protein [Mucilaginibacter aquariorum]